MKVRTFKRIGLAVFLIYIVVATFSCLHAATIDDPLMNAAGRGDTDTVRQLLKNGANPNYDFEGESPLSFAVSSGSFDTVELLLQAGADPKTALGTSRPSFKIDPKIQRLLDQAQSRK